MIFLHPVLSQLALSNHHILPITLSMNHSHNCLGKFERRTLHIQSWEPWLDSMSQPLPPLVECWLDFLEMQHAMTYLCGTACRKKVPKLWRKAFWQVFLFSLAISSVRDLEDCSQYFLSYLSNPIQLFRQRLKQIGTSYDFWLSFMNFEMTDWLPSHVSDCKYKQ